MSDTEDTGLFDPDTSLVSGEFCFSTPPRPRIEHYDAWQCNACLLLQLCKKKHKSEVPSHCPTCGSTDLQLCLMQLNDQGCGPNARVLCEHLTSAATANELKSGDETSWVEDADGGFVTRDSLSNHTDSTVDETRHDSAVPSPVRPAALSGPASASEPSPPWTTVEKSPKKRQGHQKEASLFDKRRILLNTLKVFPPSGGPLSYKEELQVLDVTQPLPLRIAVGGRYDLLLSDDVKNGTGCPSACSSSSAAQELPLRLKHTRTSNDLADKSDAEPAAFDGKGKASVCDEPARSFKICLHKPRMTKMQRIRALSAKFKAMGTSEELVASPTEANDPVPVTSPPVREALEMLKAVKAHKRTASTQVSPSIIKRLETEETRTAMLQHDLDTAIRQQELLLEDFEKIMAVYAHIKASKILESGPDLPSRGRHRDRTSPPTRARDDWNFTVSADTLRSTLEVMKTGKEKGAYKSKVLPEHIRFDAIKDGKWYVMSHDY